MESQTDEELEWELIARFDFLSRELKHVEILNLLNQPFDDKGAFITIAALDSDLDSPIWVGMLMRMYLKWCETNQYKIRLVDEYLAESGGFSYLILEIIGEYAYGYLKSEQGIHQLRRISPFCKKPRIKTSLAKVEVTPILDETVNFEIPIQELEITGKHSLYGRSLWAKVLHIPTGISFTSRSERSQLQNKEKALAFVKGKLFSLMQSQNVTLRDIKNPNSKNVTNNPIREYTFHPYQKVNDLRTNVETSDIEEVIKGNLDMFIKAYLKQTH